jgi:hypothetical protein
MTVSLGSPSALDDCLDQIITLSRDLTSLLEAELDPEATAGVTGSPFNQELLLYLRVAEAHERLTRDRRQDRDPIEDRFIAHCETLISAGQNALLDHSEKAEWLSQLQQYAVGVRTPAMPDVVGDVAATEVVPAWQVELASTLSTICRPSGADLIAA